MLFYHTLEKFEALDLALNYPFPFFFFSSLYSDQIWRRYHWDSPINWLHSDTRKCGISGAKDWPYTLQGLNQLCSRHSFICCKDHFPPTTIEVLSLKQQCWIMVTYHVPWWRTSNFKGRWWQCVCSHQGRQLPLDSLSKLKYSFIISYKDTASTKTFYVINLWWWM